MKKIRNPTYHIGDNVQITNHEYFERVGFPMQYHQDIMENPNFRNVIDKETDKLLSNPIFPWYSENGCSFKGKELIRKGLAFCVLQAKNFGGNERKIYTNLDYPLPSKCHTVLSKKLVRTGVFQNKRIKGRNNVILLVQDEKYNNTR